MLSLSKTKTRMVRHIILSMPAMLVIAGCLNLNGSHRRIFSYHPPEHKATVELSDNTDNEFSSVSENSSDVDSHVKFTQAKVNDSLERLMRALNNSKMKKRSAPLSTNSQLEVVENDPDSLAAKLSAQNPIRKSIVSNDNKQQKEDIQQRPIITPIRKNASFVTKSKLPEVKSNQLVSTVKPISQAKPQIKIVKVEPIVIPQQKPASQIKPTLTSVKTDVHIPLTEKTSEKTNNNKEQVKAVHQANESVKINLPDVQSDPNSALEHLVSKLEKKIKNNPNDTATVVKLRLIQALLGQYKLAMQDNVSGDKLKGEKLANDLARLVKIFSDEHITQAQQINQAADIVEQMQDRLSEIADLKIANLKLCREVQSFGSYKVMPDDYFVIGKRLPVIVYIELEHFVSKYIAKEKIYTTELALTIEIIDPKSGTVAWRHHDEYIKDVSQNRRRDFYIARLITLPASLPAGKLQLKVTVEDLTGNKVAQSMLSFTMHKP